MRPEPAMDSPGRAASLKAPLEQDGAAISPCPPLNHAQAALSAKAPYRVCLQDVGRAASPRPPSEQDSLAASNTAPAPAGRAASPRPPSEQDPLAASNTAPAPAGRAVSPKPPLGQDSATAPNPAAPSSAPAPRFARQVALPAIGPAGQAALASARVAILGAGALGTASAELLCRAGVGFIRIADRDYVGASNLQRSALFTEADVCEHTPKAVAAKEHLQQIDAGIEVEALVTQIDAYNIQRIISGADVVLDGSDNFELRFLLNDACVKSRIPWIHGAALGTTGALMVIKPGGPCLRCLMPVPPAPGSFATCATAGVLGASTQIVAAMQAVEAIKLLISSHDNIEGYLSIDVWRGEMEASDVARDPDCPCCSQGRFSFLDPGGSGAAGKSTLATALCGRDEIQVMPRSSEGFSISALAARLAGMGSVEQGRHTIAFSDGELGFVVFADGRAIVRGAKDEAQAVSAYSEYIGI